MKKMVLSVLLNSRPQQDGTLVRPTQHLYPLELTCDSAGEMVTNFPSVQLNPSVPLLRPRRDVTVAAKTRIQELNSYDHGTSTLMGN